ncbi:U3 small nucleolar ribonucleoprotein protein MPP10 [Rhodnius prolixus]|uniref:U3 small nucleolar ribonucleoprotein protein MPP10 n=2 Tax=Rhodnius TaxID=13248 RepID=T1HVG6_RHOPR
MISCFSEFIELLENVEKHPDFHSRITKKDSKFIDITWNILLNIYEQVRVKEENDPGKGKVETTGKELKELVENGAIDDEGIWHLLELINCRRDYISTIACSAVMKNRLQLPLKIEEENCDKEVIDVAEEEDEDVEDGGSEENEDEKKDVDEISSQPTRTKKPDFFDEEAMLKFLDKSENTDKGKNDSDVDYFDDIPSEDDSEAGGIMYDEFFEESEEVAGTKSLRNDLSDESDSEREDKTELEPWKEEEESGDESDRELMQGLKSSLEKQQAAVLLKSSFELKQEKLRNKINKLEEEALQEKAWPLKGEVEASQRPVNSLLEEIVEIDLSQRPAPVVTKEVTLKLEDIILKRIKDSAYDDVEKKFKPVESPHEFKKAIVLDQEKSKLSLAEVYEKEYLKQKSDQTVEKDKVEKMTPEQEEIKKLMHFVFKKLDTLSNFHFVPKPAIPEIKIVSNLPAVMVEEVAPEATSRGNLLAPEEISSESKRQLISKEERSATDKKRERRKKKKLQAIKAKRTQNIPNTSISSLTKSRNVKLLNESTNATVKSSKHFFNKFQEDLDTNATIKKRKLDKSVANVDVKKFKF